MPKANRPRAALNSPRTEGKCSLAERSLGTKTNEISQAPRVAAYSVDEQLLVHAVAWEVAHG